MSGSHSWLYAVVAVATDQNQPHTSEKRMQTRVTERDLQHFVSLGFFAPVTAGEAPAPEELAESVVRVLQAPTARLTTAAALALNALASSDDLDAFADFELADEVRRSLGYLAERVAGELKSSKKTAQRLTDFSDDLHQSDDSEQPAVVLMARSNATLLRLKRERADEVNRRWNVFGTPVLSDQ